MTRRRIASLIAIGAVAFAGYTLYEGSAGSVDVMLVVDQPVNVTRVELVWIRDGEVAVASAWPFAPGEAPAELPAPKTLEPGPYRLKILVERAGFSPTLEERDVELLADGRERILLPGPPAAR